jgi:hypothetical protein
VRVNDDQCRRFAAKTKGIARCLPVCCLRTLRLLTLPLFIAGTLKILYDLLFYRAFVEVQPPEERCESLT